VGTPPLVFQHGTFLHDGAPTQVSQLDILPTPTTLVATTYHTDIGDAFLNDLITYMEDTIGYRDIESHSRRGYGSTVVVEFDEAVSRHIRAIEEIEKYLSNIYTKQLGTDLTVEFERLTFSPDPLDIPVGVMQFFGNFVIERRANHPYSENRFFSTAPLRTNDHLAALGKIESILRESRARPRA